MKHLSPAEIETIRVPEPKHDPFSLESLVAWLEKMPADGTYDFTDAKNCAAAQCLRAHGVRDYKLTSNRLEEIGWFRIVNGRDFGQLNTFGAALTRARAALASQKGNANG